jgi:mono/diheme cytochrome c family protein
MSLKIFKSGVGFFLGFVVVFGWGIPHGALAEEPLQCPQPRFTKKAPGNIYNLKNPLEATPKNLKKGKMLYQVRAKPMPCKHCHGASGDGRGPMARGFNPPPRDFTCTKTIKGVPDGQLFWIIKNGSPGTGMLAFKGLKDEQIWQILLYVRQLTEK